MTAPARLSSFVGRAAQVEALAGLVRGRRLVTVTGRAGVGKTTLAARTSPGAWVPLASVAEPALVPEAVHATLGVANRAQLTAEVTRREA